MGGRNNVNRHPFNRTLLLAVLLCLVSALAPAQQQVLPDFQADPSARVFNGRLYVYPSHDRAGSKDWDMVDWHAFSTDDMVHFKDHGVIFSLNDITWAKDTRGRPTASRATENTISTFPLTIRSELPSPIRQQVPSRTLSASL